MQVSQCQEVFNGFCHKGGYIKPAALKDALVDYCWGNTVPTVHSVDNALKASIHDISFDNFLKLSKEQAKDSFNGVLNELNERDQAILVLTREHVTLHSPRTTC